MRTYNHVKQGKFWNSFKVGLSPSPKELINLLQWKPFKMMKNAFYFILKVLFVFKILNFLSSLLGHVFIFNFEHILHLFLVFLLLTLNKSMLAEKERVKSNKWEAANKNIQPTLKIQYWYIAWACLKLKLCKIGKTLKLVWLV